MTTRIVVTVTDEHVSIRDAAVKQGAVIAEARYLPGELDCVIRQLATEVKDTWRRSAKVILNLSTTQARLIDGLPMTHDARALERVVAASPYRYFLKLVDRATVCSVHVVNDGECVCALVDADIMTTAITSLSTGGFAVNSVVAQVELEGDGVISEFELPRLAWRDNGRRLSLPSFPAVVAGVLLLVSAASAPLIPLARLHHSAETAALQRDVDRAVTNRTEIERLQSPLRKMRELGESAGQPILALDAVMHALATDGRVISFDADSSRVEARISTPSLSVFVRRLEKARQVSDVALLGGVSPDSAANAVQATVRFHFGGVSAP